MKIISIFKSFYPMVLSFVQQDEKSQPEIVGDILEPDAIAFAFETVGWKILAVLFIIASIVLSYKWLKSYKKNKYRREAVHKLLLIKNQNTKSNQKLNQINIILKQVAMITFGRTKVAQLYGEDWLAFLDTKVKRNAFLDYAISFDDAIYKNKEIDEDTLNSIFSITKSWINEHS